MDGGGAPAATAPSAPARGAAAQTAPAPLPPAVAAADERVRAVPFDVASWRVLIEHALGQPAAAAATVFADFLEVFPTSAEHWRLWAEKEHADGRLAEAEAVLNRCLLRVPDPRLWKFYVDFVTDTRLAPALRAGAAPDALLAARAETARAYEYALERVGLVVGAEPLWQAYLTFLKAAPAAGSFEVAQRNSALRRAYQRAVAAPLPGAAALWDEYGRFEREAAPEELAAKTLAAHEAGHRVARRVADERAGLWAALALDTLPLPPPAPADGSADAARLRAQQDAQVAAWRRALAFEGGNPLRLPAERHAALVRVCFELALLRVRCHPDLWHDYALFEVARGNVPGAAAVYERALEAVPQCGVLAFAAADFLEGAGETDRARAVYEGLLERAPSPLVFVLYQRFARRCDGVAAARRVFARGRRAAAGAAPSLFLAAAALELHANRDADAARNILELGRRTFAADAEFALGYLELAASLLDEGNTRALFENLLEALPRDVARPVWDRYLSFELTRALGGGSLDAVGRLEQRFAAAFPEDARRFSSPLLVTLHRHCAWGLMPAAVGDLDLLRRHPYAATMVHTGTGVLVDVRGGSSSGGGPALVAQPPPPSLAPPAAVFAPVPPVAAMPWGPLTKPPLPAEAPPTVARLFERLAPWPARARPSDEQVEFVLHLLDAGTLPPRPAAPAAPLEIRDVVGDARQAPRPPPSAGVGVGVGAAAAAPTLTPVEAATASLLGKRKAGWTLGADAARGGDDDDGDADGGEAGPPVPKLAPPRIPVPGPGLPPPGLLAPPGMPGIPAGPPPAALPGPELYRQRQARAAAASGVLELPPSGR